uniref:PHD finger protein 13 n=1 Tax=Lygus hesperus TaxID=30085 RepID=A0A0A9Z1V9_LYGHE
MYTTTTMSSLPYMQQAGKVQAELVDESEIFMSTKSGGGLPGSSNGSTTNATVQAKQEELEMGTRYCVCCLTSTEVGLLGFQDLPMIECESECHNWFHGACIGVQVETFPENEPFVCNKCQGKRYNKAFTVSP